MLGAAAGLAIGSVVGTWVANAMLHDVYMTEPNIDRVLLIAGGVTLLFGILGAVAGATSWFRKNPGAMSIVVLTTVLGYMLLGVAYAAGGGGLPRQGVVDAFSYWVPASGLVLAVVPAVRRRPFLWIAMAIFAAGATVAARLWLDLVIGPYSVTSGLVVLFLGLALGALVGSRALFEKHFDIVLGLAGGASFAWYVSLRTIQLWDLDYRLYSILPAAGALLGAGAGFWYSRRRATSLPIGLGLHG